MQPIHLNKERRALLRVAGAMSAAACAFALLPASASAQEWPTKPVRIVIATAAGSSGDTVARLLAPKLEALWKHPVIVENKPGAGGALGTGYAINAGDGHTLLLGTQSSLLPKFTTKNLSYDPQVDLIPVYKVINYQLVIAANAPTAQKAKTLAELVALSKSMPNGVFFGGSGQTSIFNLTMGLLNKQLGIKYAPVDFNNIGAMNLAVLRDDAQFLVNTPSSIKGYIDNGQLKPLAAINAERYPNFPDVPTLAEATGYKGYIPLLWAGIFAPKGTPTPVVDKIGRDFATLLADAETKKAIETRLTGSVVRSSPATFTKEVNDEMAVWKDLFSTMNFKPE
ncbi:MAG: tripartite tricarboxylate transporter substrate binding protein [Pseudomonadota bacterium]